MAKQILVAEDEPNILISLEFLLKTAGHDVSLARDGEEALRKLHETRPDLIVLDIMLPLVNGFEICRRIREDPALRETKVLMLTARGRQTEVARGLEAGANSYMTKPFATQELLRAVGELLGIGPASR
jgi:two-component system, OmpR family, alkaline phosphatase synthesis response regulator PhoP